MTQLEKIEAIEKRLWSSADTLRANSNYASNEYFLSVMGLIFLRHAYSRYLAVKDEIEEALPTRDGKKRALTKEDFSKKSAIYLEPIAQFDYLVSLTDSDDRARALIDAMESIERDYETLRGVLPKQEYRELDNEILAQLLRNLNPEELKNVSGDVFGRIYEYFLTQFADQKAHDGGEFFTPVSLVSLIANVLEPKKGTVLDPACGSGGMFVQCARFVERIHKNPINTLNFLGLEKNATTINLAKMNLAVHGLVGDIKKAITYYEDPHDMYHKADFVMANPPFNVDEIDADKIKNDPRLPFGLPGVNKKGKVSNGNYVWISYFYSYLNDIGRAGFVMSSQASSAGGVEAKVRRKLIETSHVDIMIAIRSNFFYTRSVPCELWFFDKAKPESLKDKVLMIDARDIYRKVTRRIFDFSPEQQQNILSIIWLYRGQNERFYQLINDYISKSLDGALTIAPFAQNYEKPFTRLENLLKSFLDTISIDENTKEIISELEECQKNYQKHGQLFTELAAEKNRWWKKLDKENMNLISVLEELQLYSEVNNKLIKEAEMLYRLINRLIEQCSNKDEAKNSSKWNAREIQNYKKDTEQARDNLVSQLKQVRYFYHNADWLITRFSDGQYRDVEGLVKLVDREELKENDWSLTPGRYVGVAQEEEDPNFNFSETMHNIHKALEELNIQANELAEKISDNFRKLGI